MFAKPPPYKKVRNEPEEILNVVGSDTVIEANDSAHSPIERCQVVNAEQTVTRASELNNREAELRIDTETAGDDAIKDDILQDALVRSNDKLHIEQVCKAHKGAKRYSCLDPTQRCGGDRAPPRFHRLLMQLLVYSTLVSGAYFNPLMPTVAI